MGTPLNFRRMHVTCHGPNPSLLASGGIMDSIQSDCHLDTLGRLGREAGTACQYPSNLIFEIRLHPLYGTPPVSCADEHATTSRNECGNDGVRNQSCPFDRTDSIVSTRETGGKAPPVARECTAPLDVAQMGGLVLRADPTSSCAGLGSSRVSFLHNRTPPETVSGLRG